ncbi:MAG TPA: cytochrome c [Rhodoblastus sp.]|nr:cytochrome c [Rhodoblastus sp.]
MKIVPQSLALVVFLAAAGPAAAADVDAGLKLAGHWCAACHVVSDSQTRASADVPTFANIAQRKSARDLSLFLTKPHGQMPDMSLSRPEVADLVAYIVSLGPNPLPPEPKREAPASGLNGAIVPQK